MCLQRQLLATLAADNHQLQWPVARANLGYQSPQPLQLDYIAHGGLEALSCDWNKYKPNVVASAGTDKAIRIWDLRMIAKLDNPVPGQPLPAYHLRGPTPLNELLGHEFAVRKVVWSPHLGQELLLTSYDMTSSVGRSAGR